MRLPGTRLLLVVLFLATCFLHNLPPATSARAGLNLAGQIGGSMLALDLSGEHVLIGAGPRLLVVDTMSPQFPVVAGQSITLPDVVRDIRAVDGIAYVAAGPGGLHMIDVHVPTAPVYLGYQATPGSAVSVAVSGGTAYVATAGAALQIIDVSHPSLPRLITAYAEQANASDVQVVGSRAYVVANNRLTVLDVQNPGAPRPLGVYNAAQGLARVWIGGTRAYLAASGQGLQIVDVGDPSRPRLLGDLDTSGSAVDVQVADGLAYVADTVGGLQIVNVRNPARPVPVGAFATADSALRVRVAGEIAYAAVLRRGLLLIDIHDPARPSAAGLFSPPADVSRVDARGTVAYAAGDRRLSILDVSTPAAPHLLGTYFAAAPILDLATARPDPTQPAQTFAVLALGSSGLQIVDVHDPTTPVATGTYQSTAALQRVAVSGTLAYVGTSAGLEIVNLRDPTGPNRIGGLVTGGPVSALRVAGGLAYLATSLAFEIVDVHNAGSPVRLGTFTILYGARDVALIGESPSMPATLAYLAAGWPWSGGSLLVLDVSRPQAPRLINARDTAGGAGSIALGPGLAFVTSLSCAAMTCQNRVIAYDIRDPAAPLEQTTYQAPSTVGQVRFAENTLYLANRESGLLLLVPGELAERQYLPVIVKRGT